MFTIHSNIVCKVLNCLFRQQTDGEGGKTCNSSINPQYSLKLFRLPRLWAQNVQMQVVYFDNSMAKSICNTAKGKEDLRSSIRIQHYLSSEHYAEELLKQQLLCQLRFDVQVYQACNSQWATQYILSPITERIVFILRQVALTCLIIPHLQIFSKEQKCLPFNERKIKAT